MPLHTRNILFFFMCLLYIMPITRTVLATTPSTLTHPLRSKSVISPTLAIILFCLVLCLMAVVFVYISRITPYSFDQAMGFHFIHQRNVTHGLDSNIIQTFPIFVYSDVKALKIGKSILECAVCINEFKDEETLRLIPHCCHVFHPQCIDAWLAFHTTCPVCRTNLETKLVQENHVEFQNVNSHERNDAVIDIHVNINGPQEVTNGHSYNPNNIKTPTFVHLPPKSTPRRPKILNMFTRSHSTGHSLIQPNENCERFTLRLPNEARKSLVDIRLSRSNNTNAVPFSPERSSTKGYRFLPTPPMFAKLGPVKEEKEPYNLLKSVKSVKLPLSTMFCGKENDDDDKGERSFTYLRSSTSN